LNFIFAPEQLPKPAHSEQVSLGLERWRVAAEKAGGELSTFAADYAKDPQKRPLIESVFGNSPFLSHSLVLEMEFFRQLMEEGADRSFESLIDSLPLKRHEAGAQAPTPQETMRALRIAKRRASLLIALADIAGVWELEQVTLALSRFADAVIASALQALLAKAGESGAAPGAGGSAKAGAGLVILGLGKLGGFELNYSSDIDLIVLYDDESYPQAQRSALQPGFVRLTRDLVRMLDERTGDGYVFRTDLRLRPDPGATPLALSVLAAETYYESLGQNWERSALIKARPVAGDFDAGAAFLRRLAPFIWRKNLDFAAIQDIHSIKRQINAHHGSSGISVLGHNLKLGRGGIREIEFFTQTQQLIWGGRNPALRGSTTCDSLRALAQAGRVEPESASIMIEAYRFLRRVEHRLQMIEDRQTHTLPTAEKDLAALAVFLGYDGADDFSRDLLAQLRRVEEIYADLFEDTPSQDTPGNLIFTGSDNDPETLESLKTLGFRDGVSVMTTIRAWYHGRYRATRSERTLELLREMTPTLLTALAETANPDTAFFKFNDFLAGLPAGVQLFSLFQANPELLTLLAEIMGSAPRLADHLSRRSALFDAVLTPGFFDSLPGRELLQKDLERELAGARDFEDILDLSRRWANDRKFQIGVQILRNLRDADAAGEDFSNIAESVIAALLPAVETDFAKQHGRLKDAGMAVLALGKLGGREMTCTSDLDLILIHDATAKSGVSDGPRPLPAAQYLARLSQRLISALTSPTSEGRLYEVDMRLRPSGNAGPIASSLEAFRHYQRQAAWTWERLALTRARVICGPPRLRRQIEALIHDVITTPHDPAALVVDVNGMRKRIAAEYPGRSEWDIKYRRGGLIDIEYITQYLQLRHASKHPEILCTNTTGALTQIRDAGLIDAQAGNDLIEAVRLWRRLQGMIRLTAGEPFREEEAPTGLRKALAKAGGAPSFEGLKIHMEETADRVRGLYDAIIIHEPPES
jgi:glutamate-ammonia-ligase adenylyltransferase